MDEILIKKFIGKNADVIYDKMEKKGSFNIFCMLFSFFYFLYRKMYLVGLISFLIQAVIANYIKNVFVSIICMIILGFIFYPLYKIHIRRKISKIREKVTTEEEINNMCEKKGGTSIVAAIIIPVILILVLIASLGMKVLDSATDNINNQNNNSNISNYYSYNGAKIKYDNEWQQEYVGLGEQTYTALCEKNGDIIIVCLQVADINDGLTDYSINSNRQKLYDELINSENATYSTNGIAISKQTYGFKKLFDNTYYEYHEIYKNGYVRTYTIINVENNTAASLMIVSESNITDIEDAKINELLRTIEF